MPGLSRHLLLSALTSLLSYAFLMVIANALGPAEYGSFSEAWSLLGFLLVFATIAGYRATIRLDLVGRVRAEAGLYLLVSGACVAASLLTGHGFLFLPAVVASSAAQCVLAGRMLGQLRYASAGLLNLACPLFKIAFFLCAPTAWSVELRIYGALLVATGLSALAGFWLTRKDPLAAPAQGSAGPAVTLATASHILPNADMLWLSVFGNSQASITIAPVALITRGLFFLQLIFAQWWLPRRHIHGRRLPLRKLFIGSILVVAISLAGVVIFRSMLVQLLGWEAPDLGLALWASAAAAFAAIFYQNLQLAALATRNLLLLMPLFLILAGALLAGFLGCPPLSVHALALALYGCATALTVLLARGRASADRGENGP
jgi:hypothetical protein